MFRNPAKKLYLLQRPHNKNNLLNRGKDVTSFKVFLIKGRSIVRLAMKVNVAVKLVLVLHGLNWHCSELGGVRKKTRITAAVKSRLF